MRRAWVRALAREDCGPAALATVLGHHGVRVAPRDLRAPGSLGSVSLLELVEAARRLGFGARAVRAAPSELHRLPLPAVVHLNEDHWVVLTAVEPGGIGITDPGQGPIELARSEFEARWSGYAAVVEPSPRPAADG